MTWTSLPNKHRLDSLSGPHTLQRLLKIARGEEGDKLLNGELPFSVPEIQSQHIGSFLESKGLTTAASSEQIPSRLHFLVCFLRSLSTSERDRRAE
jgi:hypothetical protein